MGSLILARNVSFIWAFISCAFAYPYIGAGFIAIGMLSHWLLIRAVFAMLPGQDNK